MGHPIIASERDEGINLGEQHRNAQVNESFHTPEPLPHWHRVGGPLAAEAEHDSEAFKSLPIPAESREMTLFLSTRFPEDVILESLGGVFVGVTRAKEALESALEPGEGFIASNFGRANATRMWWSPSGYVQGLTSWSGGGVLGATNRRLMYCTADIAPKDLRDDIASFRWRDVSDVAIKVAWGQDAKWARRLVLAEPSRKRRWVMDKYSAAQLRGIWLVGRERGVIEPADLPAIESLVYSDEELVQLNVEAMVRRDFAG